MALSIQKEKFVLTGLCNRSPTEHTVQGYLGETWESSGGKTETGECGPLPCLGFLGAKQEEQVQEQACTVDDLELQRSFPVVMYLTLDWAGKQV